MYRARATHAPEQRRALLRALGSFSGPRAPLSALERFELVGIGEPVVAGPTDLAGVVRPAVPHRYHGRAGNRLIEFDNGDQVVCPGTYLRRA